MSDTTTITPEERAGLRGILSEHGTGQVEDRIILRLLNALEQAETHLAAALQMNAARQAEVMADMLNSMMAGISGQKDSVRVEVGGFQCPYCNEISKTIEAATAHDAIRPKHPAVIRAEQAEADVARLQQRVNELLSEELTDGAVRERIQLRFNMHEVLQQNERLTKERDWLADALHRHDPHRFDIEYWKSNARKAVAAGEE